MVLEVAMELMTVGAVFGLIVGVVLGGYDGIVKGNIIGGAELFLVFFVGLPLALGLLVLVVSVLVAWLLPVIDKYDQFFTKRTDKLFDSVCEWEKARKAKKQ